MKLTHIFAATALAGVIATPAFAGSPTLSSVPHTASKGKVTVKLGGQINQAIVIAGDGESTEVGFVSNDASQNRFFISWDGKFGDGFSAGGKIEMEIELNASDKWMSDSKIFGDVEEDFLNLRHAMLWVKYGNLKLSGGQTSAATDGTLEADLSGTKNVAYANVDAFLEEKEVIAKGGAVHEIEDFLFGEDGAGRQLVAKAEYEFGESGFVAGASVGQTDGDTSRDAPLFYDIALDYKGKIGGTKIKAAAGHVFNFENDEDMAVTDLSASVLFSNGFNLTGAWERVHRDGGEDSDLFFAKAGFQTDAICDWGTSALSVSYARGDDMEGGKGREGNDVAFAFAQDVDAIGTEFYAGFHHYWFDRPGFDYYSVNAGIIGMQTKF